jgi:hypothetical protein
MGKTLGRIRARLSEKKNRTTQSVGAESNSVTEGSSAEKTQKTLEPSGAKAEKSESIRDKLVIAIVAALLSFFGAVGGTMFASQYERTKWDRETNYTAKKELLNKRIELVERTVRVLNQTAAAATLFSSANLSHIEGQQKILSNINNREYKEGLETSIQSYLNTILKLEELRAEYATVLSLDVIYFGDKTRQAVQGLSPETPKWWEVEQPKKKALLDAMQEELSQGF